MNWFGHNRFLGTFVVVLAIATIGALVFLWLSKSGFDEAKAMLDENIAELNRLQQLQPFPTDVNLRKMRTQHDDYAAELNKTKEELQRYVLPVTPMAPNEFQARLRQAMTTVAERARANRVKLPDNFYLGFEEFAAALPDTTAAPVLGQQLAQVELLINTIIDAKVDAISSFKRVPPGAARASATATPTPAPSPAATPRKPGAEAGPPALERTATDVTFVSNPAAARRVLNQVSTTRQQFYVIRTLHIMNEKDKGPARDGAGAVGGSAATANAGTGAAAVPGAAGSNAALTFIVGNERIQTSARVEMLRFNLPPR